MAFFTGRPEHGNTEQLFFLNPNKHVNYLTNKEATQTPYIILN